MYIGIVGTLESRIQLVCTFFFLRLSLSLVDQKGEEGNGEPKRSALVFKVVNENEIVNW